MKRLCPYVRMVAYFGDAPRQGQVIVFFEERKWPTWQQRTPRVTQESQVVRTDISGCLGEQRVGLHFTFTDQKLGGKGIDDGALGNLATGSQQMATGNKGSTKSSQDGSNIRIIKAWLSLINPHIQTYPPHNVGFSSWFICVVWLFSSCYVHDVNTLRNIGSGQNGTKWCMWPVFEGTLMSHTSNTDKLSLWKFKRIMLQLSTLP